MQGFMSQFGNFMQNPMQMLLQRRINIPQGINGPGQIINYMMQSGQMSQADYNNANYLYQQVKRNPMFRR
jgi:hypothetical protein